MISDIVSLKLRIIFLFLISSYLNITFGHFVLLLRYFQFKFQFPVCFQGTLFRILYSSNHLGFVNVKICTKTVKYTCACNLSYYCTWIHVNPFYTVTVQILKFHLHIFQSLKLIDSHLKRCNDITNLFTTTFICGAILHVTSPKMTRKSQMRFLSSTLNPPLYELKLFDWVRCWVMTIPFKSAPSTSSRLFCTWRYLHHGPFAVIHFGMSLPLLEWRNSSNVTGIMTV